MNKKQMMKPFEITSICRQDIIMAFEGVSELTRIKERVELMDDDDMKQLARQMADAYCGSGFWEDLRIIFEHRFLEG